MQSANAVREKKYMNNMNINKYRYNQKIYIKIYILKQMY